MKLNKLVFCTLCGLLAGPVSLTGCASKDGDKSPSSPSSPPGPERTQVNEQREKPPPSKNVGGHESEPVASVPSPVEQSPPSHQVEGSAKSAVEPVDIPRSPKTETSLNETPQTRPVAASTVESVLRGSTDKTVSGLLLELATVQDAQQVNIVANRLVNEIFSEPDMTDVKLTRLNLNIDELSQNHLYDRELAKRMAFVDALLDQRIRNDGQADVLKDSLLIAGTSTLFGAAAGFHGFDGMRSALREWNPAAHLYSARDRMSGLWSSLRRGGGEAVGGSKAAGYLEHANLPAHQAVERNLIAIGLDGGQVRSLKLTVAEGHDVPALNFKPTGVDHLIYAVTSTFARDDLGQDRQLVFALIRPKENEGGVVVSGYAVSARMDKWDAMELAGQIDHRVPQDGGYTVVSVIDPVTGGVSGSRVAASEIRDLFDDVVREVPDPVVKARRARRTSSRARSTTSSRKGKVRMPNSTAEDNAVAEGDSVLNSEVDGGGQNLAESIESIEVREGANEVPVVEVPPAETPSVEVSSVEVTSVETPSAEVTSAEATRRVGALWNRFDKPRAAAVTGVSAASQFGFYFQGYDRGRRYGRKRPNLYLESLIPRDRLEQVLTTQPSDKPTP